MKVYVARALSGILLNKVTSYLLSISCLFRLLTQVLNPHSNHCQQASYGPMSNSVQVDDQTPLLPSQSVRKTKFPWAQFSIILCLRVVEPLHSHVLHPFLPQVCPLFLVNTKWECPHILVNSSFEISELLMEKRVKLGIMLEPWYVSNLSPGSSPILLIVM